MKLLNAIKLFMGDMSILAYLLYLIFRREIAFTIKFPKAKRSELIILANGPSLAYDLKTNIDIIKQNDTFVVNFFPLDNYFFEVKPKFLILADPIFWEAESKYEPVKTKERLRLMRENLMKVNWEFIIYLPVFARKNNNLKDIQNDYVKIEYYNSAAPPAASHKWFTYYFYNRNILMPKPRNILIASTFIGVKMEYKTIKLIGADHSWSKDVFVSDENVLCQKERHFDNQVGKITRYCDTEGNASLKTHEFFHSLYIAFSSYWQLKDYAVKKKVQIFNCTKGSFIDAFDRGNL